MRNNSWKIILGVLATAVAAVTAPAFSYILDTTSGLPIKWPAGTISLKVMLGTTPTLSDGTTFNTSAQGAAQAWNAVIGSAQFSVNFATPSNATDNNDVNELVFASDVFGQAFDSNTLAITTTWTLGTDRTESDIIFNSGKTWDSYDGTLRSALDFQRVALHELGHSLGLDHPDDAGQTVTAIMNAFISNLDTLAADDIAGARNLYGPPGVPANDNFTNAISVSFSGTTVSVNGFNTNATKQTGEPNHAQNAGGHSVWWKWTASQGGTFTLDTRGSYYDTTLAVYTGTAVNALTEVSSNDDITRGSSLSSSLTFSATAGTTYYFAVDGWDADSGAITLNLTFGATSGGGGGGFTPPTNPPGPPPAITSQPASATVTAGGTASFTVTATGTGPLIYQWYYNGAFWGQNNSPTLTLANVTTDAAGSYYVTVTNANASVASDIVTLTVNRATPPPANSGGGSGGGGGGGAPSLWFYGVLSALAAARSLYYRRRQ